jgi:sarcosine oxidase
MRDADVVVLGLGTIGAAALYHLACRGAAPLGLDQFVPVHPHGSSFGRSRGLRTFYHEPIYTQWAVAALSRWRSLEAAAGERLFIACGWMAFARPDNPLWQRNLAVLQGAGVAHSVLDPAGVAARFPAMRIPAGAVACLTPEAGFLDANACVRAHLAQAVAQGARLAEPARVGRIDLDGERPVLETTAGRLRCRRLVVTPGPWAPELLHDLGLPLRVTRQQKFYFRPRDPALYRPEHMPVYVDYDRLFYGFPMHGVGIKVADDKPGEVTDPAHINRALDPDLQHQLQAWLAALTPGSELSFVAGDTCMYTLTPDSDFVIGPHPDHPAAFIGAGFSGHGFKFAPVVGQVLADLALDGRTARSIERFRPDRFGAAGAHA